MLCAPAQQVLVYLSLTWEQFVFPGQWLSLINPVKSSRKSHLVTVEKSLYRWRLNPLSDLIAQFQPLIKILSVCLSGTRRNQFRLKGRSPGKLKLLTCRPLLYTLIYKTYYCMQQTKKNRYSCLSAYLCLPFPNLGCMHRVYNWRINANYYVFSVTRVYFAGLVLVYRGGKTKKSLLSLRLLPFYVLCSVVMTIIMEAAADKNSWVSVNLSRL